MNMQLTNAGINALLRALSGDDLVFTNLKIGNGAAQTAATATDLSNPLKTLEITEITVANSKATLSVTLSNAGVEAGFRLTEIGIFAKDQDDEDEEILYAYGTEPEATADYVAASGDSVLEEEITIDAFISNAENVSALINESTVYATKANFDAHVANKANPHEVTKAQVGLSNVPNVATDDQTPTYTEASSLANLTSGERLAVAFGKISKAVRALLSHLSNYANPHAVTAAQVGAAASTHYHSAANINSGTLGVQRGGTGKGSWNARRLLYASSGSALDQIAEPSKNGSVLWGHPGQTPYWGHPSASDYGTYSGTGSSGSSNKNTIHLDAVPSVVFIRSNSSASGGFSWALLFIQAGIGFAINGANNSSAGSYNELTVSATAGDDPTVSWYGSSADIQMNHSGTNNYRWVALF